ncbi:unnamed protein product [Eruca vesicaria subsp. sativa]|uniref:S-protein homolog n=1 Tax=Eruca vesicaria subsp. sativa TaxID=29727 RepID=A0ABC8JIF6_ERUVS|nr:unnamed protein product [Eruca vesicaria subsp. sativa]
MHFLIFTLVIAICFGLNEGAPLWNTLEIQNKLSSDSILKVNCSSNKDVDDGLHEIKVNDKYQIFIREKGAGNIIVWRCTFRYGDKVEHSQTIWHAYRGAATIRTGQKRSWIARFDGIYLEKNNEIQGFKHHWIVTKNEFCLFKNPIYI